MTKVEAAWLAGFIDGEGTLSARKNNVDYVLGYLNIYNTNVQVIKYITSLIGGHVSRTNRATSRHKEGLKVSLYGRSTLPVIRAITPFLRIKQQQAQLLVELFTIQSRSTKSHREIKEQRRIMGHLVKLNRKGPPK